MSRSHKIKGQTTDQAFQEELFLWDRGIPVSVDCGLFNFQDHIENPELEGLSVRVNKLAY